MSMVTCAQHGVAQILVGLHRVGMVKLHEALENVADSGLQEREQVVEALLETLAADNYLSDRSDDDLRIAMWREYLRYKREDFRDFFSQVHVTVRGEPGDERDRFCRLAVEVFGDFELNPIIDFAPPSEQGRHPQLWYQQVPIIQGLVSRRFFKSAVRKSFSDW